ncbi:MAG TPA: hypothetical protein VK155_17415 [Bacteroidales bacterium]|jgi:hypothetical protein|nr:hypothetical protein [Bacteroidales bacterium]
MKNLKTLTAIFLVTALFSGMISQAQDKKTDPQREEELLKAIDEQKKAMYDHQKALEDQQKDLQDQQKDIEMINRERDYNFDFQDNGNMKVFRRRGNGSDNFSIMVPNVPDPPMIIGNHWFGDNEMTSWEFAKNVKESSFKKEYSFDVEKTAKSVSMSVNGDCKAGEIRVKILNPQGKTYSDVVIDENGNINVRKSFNISDKENQDKTGEWKFIINSDKATGFFRISFQTY